MAARASRVVRVMVITIVAAATSLFLYLLVNNFQFTRGRSVKVHFASIGDLNTGAWVRKAGLKVGSVTDLQPAEDEKTINVTLTFMAGKEVRTTDKFALVAKGILGDMYIEQQPGPKGSALAEEGDFYEGIPSFSITDLLGDDTMGMVTDLAGSLKGVLAVLQNNQGVLDQSVKDIARSAENVRIVTDRAVLITQSVPEITGQITSSVTKLQATVDDVSSTVQKVLAKLDTSLGASADDLSASMKSVKEITNKVQDTVTQLTAQNSVISRLGSAETAKSLDETVKNLNEISQQLLAVSRDAQKIVTGVGSIFDAK